MRHTRFYIISFTIGWFCCAAALGQLIDDFNDAHITKDSSAMNGWAYFTGDGAAQMDFVPGRGYAAVTVDATKDTRNIWWALIKRRVSENLDLSILGKPNYELRIEARIRVSDAPRRVNLHLNTQKTTNFHTHLMEFDIPDATNWHTISMTTKDFEAGPGDSVFGQLALMDWGLGTYCVDIDYFKVDIVDVTKAGPDKGVQVPYHPPIPDLNTFEQKIPVAHDSIIDTQYPDMNFNNWSSQDKLNLLTVSGTQFVIMRWDLTAFYGKKVNGSGLLTLTTYSVQKPSEKIKDFGMVRVVEILGGQPDWDQKTVTYNNLCRSQSIDDIFNNQIIIDVDIAEGRNNKTLITISQPVLQRMIDGKTLGLALRPLGSINTSFYSMENQNNNYSPTLYFNIQE